MHALLCILFSTLKSMRNLHVWIDARKFNIYQQSNFFLMKHDMAKAEKDQLCKVKEGQQYNIITAIITEILLASQTSSAGYTCSTLVDWTLLKNTSITEKIVNNAGTRFIITNYSHGCSIIKLRLADCFIPGLHAIVQVYWL